VFAVLPDADTTEAKCGEFGLQDIQKNKSSEWGNDDKSYFGTFFGDTKK